MKFEMILDIAFPKDVIEDDPGTVSFDVFSAEDITALLAFMSSDANKNTTDMSTCLSCIQAVTNQFTSGFKSQVCEALHNQRSHLPVTAQQQSSLFLFKSALESQLILTLHEVSKGDAAVSQYKDTIDFMKSIFSTIFLDKVKAAVDKRRCKVELNGDDEHHFELYKKLCINYWCSKYGDNALETSQHSKTIAEYATSDQTPTPSEPLPKSISRLSPKRTSRSQTYLNDSTEISPKRITRSQKQLDNVEDGKVPHTMVELHPNKRVLNMKELQGSIDGEMSQRPNKCSRTMERY